MGVGEGCSRVVGPPPPLPWLIITPPPLHHTRPTLAHPPPPSPPPPPPPPPPPTHAHAQGGGQRDWRLLLPYQRPRDHVQAGGRVRGARGTPLPPSSPTKRAPPPLCMAPACVSSSSSSRSCFHAPPCLPACLPRALAPHPPYTPLAPMRSPTCARRLRRLRRTRQPSSSSTRLILSPPSARRPRWVVCVGGGWGGG